MTMTKKLLLAMFCIPFCCGTSFAAVGTPTCLTKIGQDSNFISKLKSIIGNSPLNQETIDSNKTKVYDLIAENVISYCLTDINTFNKEIVPLSQINIPFQMQTADNKTKYYNFAALSEKLFDEIIIPTGILIAPMGNKNPGDIITKNEMGSQVFFSNACSGVKMNIDDDGPINLAGQSVFKQQYPDAEYFIDFPKGEGQRAFTGLLIASNRLPGGKEQVPYFRNYPYALQSVENFSHSLRGTPCSGLYAYLVSLETKKVSNGTDTTAWGISAGVAGGALGLAAIGVISIGTAGIGLLAGAAAVGIANVLWVEDLANMEQVMVLSGPYKIR